MDEIKDFIEKLANRNVNGNVVNIYNDSDGDNKIRRENLRLYLEKMKNLNPKFILIGEAPGFRGCRLTGIPFTSEYVINDNDFFQSEEYKIENSKPVKERTATITWKALGSLNYRPLLWNAFPFYAYSEKPNREPKSNELEEGKLFLEIIFDLFQTLDKRKIGALGRVAENLLKNKMKIPCYYIKHPNVNNNFLDDLKIFFETN